MEQPVIWVIKLFHYKSLTELMEIVRNSFRPKECQPRDNGLWRQQYEEVKKSKPNEVSLT